MKTLALLALLIAAPLCGCDSDSESPDLCDSDGGMDCRYVRDGATTPMETATSTWQLGSRQ